jgi:Protein of unknown function (DUF2550)
VSDQLALAIAVTVIVLLVLATALLVLRRAIITHRGGVVECGLRRSPDEPWRHGLAEYQRSQLSWHRALSLRLRPQAVFDRSELVVVGSHAAGPAETERFGPGMIIVECEAGDRPDGDVGDRQVVELAMSRAALTGLLAWLEASPIYVSRRAS